MSFHICFAELTDEPRRNVLSEKYSNYSIVRELKVPPTIGFELIGVEDGFQDVDDESKALLVCPLTIVCFQIGSTGFEKPPPVVVERHVDVLDADVPSALSM